MHVNHQHSHQNGMVLLVSLVIIVLMTVLTASSLRSTINKVDNTASLQRQVQARIALDAELLAHMDQIRAISSTPSFLSYMTEILDSATSPTNGQVRPLPFKTAIPGNLLTDVSVTLRAWEVGSAFGPASDAMVPEIIKSLCPVDTSHLGGCNNFLIVAQGRVPGTAVTLQQMTGFWIPGSIANTD